MNCKKTIMGIAAILILIFHLYIPFSMNAVELSFQKAAYIGVDLFFFLSAYSFSEKETMDFFPFITNRLLSVYVPFVIFAVIAAFYKGWEFTRLIKVIFFIELFQKGGGSFLWFIPGIMILYFTVPFLIKVKKKFKIQALWLMLICWLVIAIVLQYGINYSTIFIFIHRLPIFFLGLYYDKIRKCNPVLLNITVVTMLPVGVLLIYQYAALTKINRPFDDFYYIVAIPFLIAFVMLCDYVSTKVSVQNGPLQFVGNISFELYAFQMIFGYDIERYLMGEIKNGQVSFWLTCLILTAISVLFHLFRKNIFYKKEKA